MKSIIPIFVLAWLFPRLIISWGTPFDCVVSIQCQDPWNATTEGILETERLVFKVSEMFRVLVHFPRQQDPQSAVFALKRTEANQTICFCLSKLSALDELGERVNLQRKKKITVSKDFITLTLFKEIITTAGLSPCSPGEPLSKGERGQDNHKRVLLLGGSLSDQLVKDLLVSKGQVCSLCAQVHWFWYYHR